MTTPTSTRLQRAGRRHPAPSARSPTAPNTPPSSTATAAESPQTNASYPSSKKNCQRLEGRLEKARDAHDDARTAAKKLRDTEGPTDAADARDELVALEHQLSEIGKRIDTLKTEIPALAEKCRAEDALAEQWRELSAAHKEKKRTVDGALEALGRAAYSKAAHTKAQEAHQRALAADKKASSLRNATADTAHLKARAREADGTGDEGKHPACGDQRRAPHARLRNRPARKTEGRSEEE